MAALFPLATQQTQERVCSNLTWESLFRSILFPFSIIACLLLQAVRYSCFHELLPMPGLGASSWSHPRNHRIPRPNHPNTPSDTRQPSGASGLQALSIHWAPIEHPLWLWIYLGAQTSQKNDPKGTSLCNALGVAALRNHISSSPQPSHDAYQVVTSIWQCESRQSLCKSPRKPRFSGPRMHHKMVIFHFTNLASGNIHFFPWKNSTLESPMVRGFRGPVLRCQGHVCAVGRLHGTGVNQSTPSRSTRRSCRSTCLDGFPAQAMKSHDSLTGLKHGQKNIWDGEHVVNSGVIWLEIVKRGKFHYEIHRFLAIFAQNSTYETSMEPSLQEQGHKRRFRHRAKGGLITRVAVFHQAIPMIVAIPSCLCDMLSFSGFHWVAMAHASLGLWIGYDTVKQPCCWRPATKSLTMTCSKNLVCGFVDDRPPIVFVKTWYLGHVIPPWFCDHLPMEGYLIQLQWIKPSLCSSKIPLSIPHEILVVYVFCICPNDFWSINKAASFPSPYSFHDKIPDSGS